MLFSDSYDTDVQQDRLDQIVKFRIFFVLAWFWTQTQTDGLVCQS